MKHRVTLCAIALLSVTLFPGRSHALSLDASALSSSVTRQLVVRGGHIQQYPMSLFEVSGQFAKTEGRDETWDVGVDNVFDLSGNVRLESDYRYFHDRSTFSGALGYGVGPFALSGGFRTEYPDEAARQTYGKITATLRYNPPGKKYALTGKAEGLDDGDGHRRIDYRLEGRYQIGAFYVGLKVEEIKDVELQALSVGVSF
jgi:hypothetical protein